MELSDTRIRAAKPSAKPYRLSDGGGLHLEVRPNGSKLWRLRYRLHGKENVFAIVKLGNPNRAAPLRRASKGNRAAVAALRIKADRHASELRPVLDELRAEGITTMEGMAAALNERGMQTPRGARWHASSVRNLLARICN